MVGYELADIAPVPCVVDLTEVEQRLANKLDAACAAAASEVSVEGIAELVTSSALLTSRVLRAVLTEQIASGREFIEWGSGLGPATCVAQSLGFLATGIEIEPTLVANAQRIARQCSLDPKFLLGSYKPESAYRESATRADLILDDGFDVAAADVIYCYPWPAEEQVVEWLFTQFARPDALLLTYHGGAKFRLRRRVAR